VIGPPRVRRTAARHWLHEGQAHAALARNYLRLGRFGEAIEHAARALAIG
jgi:Flp pilus assembly protein TadD